MRVYLILVASPSTLPENEIVQGVSEQSALTVKSVIARSVHSLSSAVSSPHVGQSSPVGVALHDEQAADADEIRVKSEISITIKINVFDFIVMYISC
jgi:hypothetical protein